MVVKTAFQFCDLISAWSAASGRTELAMIHPGLWRHGGTELWNILPFYFLMYISLAMLIIELFFCILIDLLANNFMLYLSAFQYWDRSVGRAAFLPVIMLILESCSTSLPNLKDQIQMKLTLTLQADTSPALNHAGPGTRQLETVLPAQSPRKWLKLGKTITH